MIAFNLIIFPIILIFVVKFLKVVSKIIIKNLELDINYLYFLPNIIEQTY